MCGEIGDSPGPGLADLSGQRGERRAAHCSYGALLLSTAIYFLSQLCGMCIRIGTLLWGLKISLYKDRGFFCCFSEFAL